MDSATRYGLYVPVTTIGTVPTWSETSGRRIRGFEHPEYIIPIPGAIGSTDDASPFAVPRFDPSTSTEQHVSNLAPQRIRNPLETKIAWHSSRAQSPGAWSLDANDQGIRGVADDCVGSQQGRRRFALSRRGPADLDRDQAHVSVT